ncbi:Serine/threonine-protein kinase PknB [Chitinispirillum alkaliphilum]|nr:Serine/threonine-protein kinase PknB [Chitinispirillum alkaliphilum]
MKKYYSINIPVGLFWKLYLPIGIIVVGIGTLLAIFAVDRFVMPNIIGVNRDVVAVPDLDGLNFEQARDRLLEEGLLIEVRSREFHDEILAGNLISQHPSPGNEVKKGRRIAVTLSRGNEIAVIPDLKGLSEHRARTELRNQGFSLGRMQRVYNAAVPADQVIESVPASGTTISRTMNVDLRVSRGRRPTHSEVPNLVGQPLAEAREIIEERGLSVGRVSHRNSPSLAPGTVVSQSVSPGTDVPFESSIELVVSVIE